ncbi:MAG: glucose sorbosone dehydrogenase [Verrucomicrobiaceae bacterium]|nr:MAG: glucose sorbosone dehydrogenase [Verrucomicrobiaceae bacterium]
MGNDLQVCQAVGHAAGDFTGDGGKSQECVGTGRPVFTGRKAEGGFSFWHPACMGLPVPPFMSLTRSFHFPWRAVLALIPLVSTGFAQRAVEVVPAFPALVLDDNAAASAVVPGADGRVVVALQRGQVRVLPGDRNAMEAPMFLDLREKMKEETDFEEGVHGIAFHPRFAENRRVYLCYSQRGPRRTVLSEFMVPEGDAFRADPRTERVVLEYPHPLGNHWGGGIAFGPDGYLYVGIGDGGLRDDPYRLAQNLWSLHGKILRLDVDTRSAGLGYGIPKDNPFADKQEIRGEIWASGFRNPWGMAFDSVSKDLWCADVGQDRWEEINVVRKGGNHGWSEREGPGRFELRAGAAEEGGPFVEPVHSYSRNDGICITGGYLYRGERLPRLKDHYLYGDWGAGKLWILNPAAAAGKSPEVTLIHPTPGSQTAINPTLISMDGDGEPLVFAHHPSAIFTLQEAQVLADAEVEESVIEEMTPAPTEGTELPGDPEVEEEATSS